MSNKTTVNVSAPALHFSKNQRFVPNESNERTIVSIVPVTAIRIVMSAAPTQRNLPLKKGVNSRVSARIMKKNNQRQMVATKSVVLISGEFLMPRSPLASTSIVGCNDRGWSSVLLKCVGIAVRLNVLFSSASTKGRNKRSIRRSITANVLFFMLARA